MGPGDDAERIAELEADNARLRRLLSQRDAPAELRHRLKSTLAMLRVIIRRSADTRRGIDAYVAHLEDRLDALARAQAAADERGWVDLHKLIADEFHVYRRLEGDRLTLCGPTLRLEPRAGQVLGLAIHELAVNAVEHGGLLSGSIAIAWQVERTEDGPHVTLTWTETAASEPKDPGAPGFGTEILTRTLPYELDARTSLTFEGSELRCRIDFPLHERIGRLADG